MICADLTRMDERERLCEDAPLLDGIVHCAGIGHRKPCKAISSDEENRTVFDVLDQSVDKIIPAGTEIMVNQIDPDGSCHGIVEREKMIPDFSSFDKKA